MIADIRMGNSIKRTVMDADGVLIKYSDFQNYVKKANDAQWEFYTEDT